MILTQQTFGQRSSSRLQQIVNSVRYRTPRSGTTRIGIRSTHVTVRPLDTTCSSCLRYQGCYRCAVLRLGISPDLVNLLSICFGYCSPLVQWYCNRSIGLKYSRRVGSKRRASASILFFLMNLVNVLKIKMYM